jgi:membrane protein implicated in regulation of membrane protease activity
VGKKSWFDKFGYTELNNRKKWTARIVIRYTLLQFPSLILLILILIILKTWVDIPGWLFSAIIILWVLKDIALFFAVWQYYDWKHPRPLELMIGKKGVAREKLDPLGYVHVNGELWLARIIQGNQPIEIDEFVEIIDIQGLLVLVKKAH